LFALQNLLEILHLFPLLKLHQRIRQELDFVLSMGIGVAVFTQDGMMVTAEGIQLILLLLVFEISWSWLNRSGTLSLSFKGNSSGSLAGV
jgi:hypothetical protein